MRLSDIKGDHVLDVIADLIDPICNIAKDEVASELFRREKLPENVTVKAFLLKRFRKAIPTLLRSHKADIIAILSTISETSPDEYSSVLNLPKLFKDCVELLTDDVFIDLFTSAQSENSSGSARENTEVPKI